MSNPIVQWMKEATTKQQIALARAAGTSRAYLYHLAAGRKHAGPELADSLAKASKLVRFQGLPLLTKESLCVACSGCEYAKRAQHA